MFLAELYTRPEDQEGRLDQKEDESRANKSDTRKTRLTLAHINKLRMMNDARTVEHEEKIKQIQQQYAQPAEEGGGMAL